MKRWIWFCGLLAAVCLLSRLPHPAVDVGKLEPVALVLVDWEDGNYLLKTDTGAKGTGKSLEQAAENLDAAASGSVFLETAEYVLLSPDVPVTAEFYRVLRPASRVCLVRGEPDLERAAAFLAAHPPERSLNDLRAGKWNLDWLRMEEQCEEAT